MNFFEVFSRSAPLFFKGALMTIQVLLLAGSLSVTLGLFLGLAMGWKIRFLSSLAEGIGFIARGIPFFVMLLIVYFVVPDLFGFDLDPFFASILALGFSSSGYTAQFVRGSLQAIPDSQWEAAFLLGYPKGKAFFQIILPQMLRILLPSLSNELDSLLKSTAIVSSIGLLELTRVGMNLVAREMEPIPIYLTLAIFYLSLSGIINGVAKYLERKFSYVLCQ